MNPNLVEDAGAASDGNRLAPRPGGGRERRGRRAALVGILLLAAVLGVGAFLVQRAFRDGRVCFVGLKLRMCSGPRDVHARWVAQQQLPREGVLLTANRLVPFVADRRDVLTWETFDPKKDAPAVMFDSVDELARQSALDVVGLLVRGEWGCDYLDGTFAVIRRGASRARNGELLACMRTPVVQFADTRADGGGDRFVQGKGVLRYWEGTRGSPRRVSYGSSVRLEPGVYKALFRAAVGKARGTSGPRGSFEVWGAESGKCLARADIDRGRPGGGCQTQVVSFAVNMPESVEPRVIGAASALWLERVTFEKNVTVAGKSPEHPGGDFPAAGLILAADRDTPRRGVVRSLQQALSAGKQAEAARLNAQLGQEAFTRTYRVLKAWEGLRDKATGLIPRGIRDPRWNGDDLGSDCFPFMLLASRYFDPATEPLWHQTIVSERRIGGVLPHVIRLPQGEVMELNHENLIFSGAEYCKDGLISIAERLGRGPWFERMEEIAGALVTDAPIDTAAGKICAEDTEVNGDVLQILPRLYWATRNEAYLRLAERTAEAYLFEVFPKHGGVPSLYWDFQAGRPPNRLHGGVVKFRDHGNEIIPGLSEIYFLERKMGRPQADRYRQPLKSCLDRILALGRTEDGLWYDYIDPVTKKGRMRISDNWGYVALAFQAFDQAEGTNLYAAEIQRAMKGAAGRKSFDWERKDPDGYADTIEGMLYFLPWFDLPECREWVDDEIEVLFAKQDTSGFIEGRYLDGNFMRTALLYGMYKTQGLMPAPWRPDVQIGASQDRSAGELTVHAEAASPWSGVLKFDPPRHRAVWGLPLNYARLNSSPEWYVVEPGKRYEIRDLDSGERSVHGGQTLIDGLPVQLAEQRPLRFVISEQR